MASLTSATVTAVEAPGERVTFVVEVTNDGDEPVTITSLTDDVYGDLLDLGNGAVSSNECPLQASAIAVGATFRCTFDAFVEGDASGPDHVNTVTAIAVDNDGTTADDGGSAVVEINPLVPRASVSGHIWLDLTPNLEFDETDPPFSGVIVWIYDAAGAEVGSIAVDDDGFYEFTELRPGDYTIVVQDGSSEPGYVVVLGPDGINDLRTTFSLTASERLDLRDFAYRGVGEIGDTVWRDDNRNGIQDSAEPGIAGVGVELVWAWLDGVLDTADDHRYPKQFTDADGRYVFGELPPGAYAVAIDPVSGITATTPTSFSINRASTESYMNADAGFAAADPTPLPNTGADTDKLVYNGVLAIMFGVLLLLRAAALSARREEDAPTNEQ